LLILDQDAKYSTVSTTVSDAEGVEVQPTLPEAPRRWPDVSRCRGDRLIDCDRLLAAEGYLYRTVVGTDEVMSPGPLTGREGRS
jgi:hypothetical protein